MTQDSQPRHRESDVAHVSGPGEVATGENGAERSPVLTALEAFNRTHPHRQVIVDDDAIDRASRELDGVIDHSPSAVPEEEQLPLAAQSDNSYRPSDDEAAAALVVAKRRNTLNSGQSNLPGGETASEDERLRQHYVACLSEIAVSRLLNRAWTGCGRGADGLRDVGDQFEVRSITDQKRGLLLRSKDDTPPPYVLVYVDVRTRECHALGWSYGHEARSNGRALDADTDRPCWILSVGNLRDWNTIRALL